MKKYVTAKPYSFLVINATHASDLFIYFTYSFFNVDNYRTNTVYNKK